MEGSSSDDNLVASLFQGENQIYPSRRNAANIDHQNQAEFPANVRNSENQEEGAEVEVEERSSRTPTLDECYAALLARPSESSVEPIENQPSSSTAPVPDDKPTKPVVNILPVNRNLIERPSSNLIAIGRKPKLPPLSASLANKQKKLTITPANPSQTHHPSLGWQADKKTLKERIAHMYCNETLADVLFVVGIDELRQTIPAHKFVLSIGSVVFDAMFNGGLTPKNTDEPIEIELPDVEPEAFLTLLKFLYSDEVSIGPESVMTTLYTAKKYAVPAMETACVEFLTRSLEADNAFMLLTQAKLFDEPQLEQLCLSLIDRDTIGALHGDGFTEIDSDTLCDVLMRDTLSIRELHLFQATLRWADAECARKGMPLDVENKQNVLQKVLPLIRFPLMDIEEFALFVEPTQLLSDREMNKIFKYLAVNPNDRPVLIYSDRSRCPTSKHEYVVSRFQRTENRWGYIGTPDRIKFTVDRRIFVVGLGLYGSVLEQHEYKAQIKIMHCGTSKTLAEHDTSFVSDGSSNPNRVCFKQPVEILPGITYIASALIRGADSYYGTKGLRRIMVNAADVTFQFTFAAMNNNGTSVEDGQIPEIVFFVAHK